MKLTAFAPGRVELLGNHTDYNEGVVLSAAIHLGVTVTGTRRDDGRILLQSAGMDAAEPAALTDLRPRHAWTDYPLGVVKMFRDAGHELGGFEAEFSSTLPVGAGLSSSAAMEVATGVFLMRLFGMALSPMELAVLCRKAENSFVGVNCGLLDQVSSIFGKKDHAIFLDCRAQSVDLVPIPKDAGLLIIHSAVKHELVGGEYNERREQCFEAARRLGVPALRDATSSQLAGADLPDLVHRRAAHVVGESERVFEALEGLRRGDAPAFGRLMSASHRSSRENFENSTEELDILVELANAQPGVHGARLTGGGFGGAIVVLAGADAMEKIAQAVLSAYEKRTGHRGAAYPCRIGNGALA